MPSNTPRKSVSLRRRISAAILSTIIGGTAISIAPPTFGQESDRITVDRVPANVQATVRANVLDSRDIDYRRFDDSGRYQVNFTTPTSLRMQIILNKEGELVAGPVLAPNQLPGGPTGAERERLVAEWSTRVNAAKTAAAAALPPAAPAPPAPAPAPAPVPGVTPPVAPPGGAVAPVAKPVATEIRAADVPKPALQSLDRFTTGGKDVNYYRLTVEDRSRYQAAYTAEDGTRREVTVADNGSLMAGPVVLTNVADDKSLLADRPDNLQVATSVRVDPTEIPRRAMDAIGQYVKTGTDVRYRRDTFADGSVGYTAHWVQADTGRRYFLTAADNGDLRQAPKLSMYQPAATPGVVEGGVAVNWTELPDRVKKTLEPLTRRDAGAAYFKMVRDNKVSYGSTYNDNGHKMWVRVDEAGETIVNPVSAVTGKPVNTNEPAQAASRVPAAMLKDRVNFADLPATVKEKILKETTGSKDVINMKHDRAGRTVYHTVWTDAATGKQKELYLDEKGEAVPMAKPAN